MPLVEFQSFPASADCHGQTWDFDPRCIIHTYRLPLLKIGTVYFAVRLHFKHELLYLVDLSYTDYRHPLTWADRLKLFFFSPSTSSHEESLSAYVRWLYENLGQEVVSQLYSWGRVSLVDDRRLNDRYVFIRIEYFKCTF